jgi:hypothetical protein
MSVATSAEPLSGMLRNAFGQLLLLWASLTYVTGGTG